MTSAGTFTPFSFLRRSPDAKIASNCRATPIGFRPRSKGERRALLVARLVGGKRAGAQHDPGLLERRDIFCARVAGGGAIRTTAASCVGGGSAGFPDDDMIDVIDASRSGKLIAKAIMPPIDAPTTWARCTPSASSNPAASAARSFSAGALRSFAAHLLHDEICEIDLHGRVDPRGRPMSRLSIDHAIAAPLSCSQNDRPRGSSGPGSHDQQDDGRATVAECLVAELLAVRLGIEFRRSCNICAHAGAASCGRREFACSEAGAQTRESGQP